MHYYTRKTLSDQHGAIGTSIDLIDKELTELRSLHWRELMAQGGLDRIASLNVQRRTLSDLKQTIESQLWELTQDG